MLWTAATTHLFNGCPVSGCRVVTPPTSIDQGLNIVNETTVEDGAEENEGGSRDFDIQGRNRYGRSSGLAGETERDELGWVLRAMEGEIRRERPAQAVPGRDGEPDCEGSGTADGRGSQGACGGGGREAAQAR